MAVSHDVTFPPAGEDRWISIMKNRKKQLLAVLSDGEFHSGQDLAALTGISRTAVWKHLRSLCDAGLEIDSVRGKGYRLGQALELLDENRIRECLQSGGNAVSVHLDVLFETASTNEYLLGRFSGPSLAGRAVLAEYQTAGRGRGGNEWLAAPASGICLSLGWHYGTGPHSLTALSLAVGVAIAEALQQAGCSRIGLKWPNDIVVDGAKLGGILIESRAQNAGAWDVVIGIGINIHLPGEMARKIDKEVTDMSRLLAPDIPRRNRLAALIINHTLSMVQTFGEQGFAPFMERWRAMDYTRGKTIRLTQANAECTGRVIDIDDNGMLIMSVNGERKKFSSGDVSLGLQA